MSLCGLWECHFVTTFPRGLLPRITAAWSSQPVVSLEGPRASGKSTLAKIVVPESNYFSFANSDPRGRLEGLPLGSVVDEYQLIPNLRLTMKLIVDERNGRPGQFLLTGSAFAPDNELGGTAALAGRQLSYRVDPFTQCELEGTPLDVLQALFESDPRDFVVDGVTHPEFLRRFAGGGLLPLRNMSPNELPRSIDNYLRGLFTSGIRPTSRDRDGLARDCCPSKRASCLTSRHHHVVGKGICQRPQRVVWRPFGDTVEGECDAGNRGAPRTVCRSTPRIAPARQRIVVGCTSQPTFHPWRIKRVALVRPRWLRRRAVFSACF